MKLLACEQVRKHFGPEPVLDGVTCTLMAGERVGLVGPNGAGKSTLMRILADVEETSAGEVIRANEARIAYLEQTHSLPHDVTVWDAATSALGELGTLAQRAEDLAIQVGEASDDATRTKLSRQYDAVEEELARHNAYHLDHRIEHVLDGLGFSRTSHRQAVGELSGGQQNRLALASLLLRPADVLLLDEPSNHLDMASTEWLERYLSEATQAMIVVSHDRYLLDRVTTQTWELFRGTVDRYTGNFSAYWRQKNERLVVQQRTYERQQEEIEKLEDFVRRNKYGQKHAQAADRVKKLDRIERVEPPREIVAPAMAFAKADRIGNVALRAEGVSKSYDRRLFHDLTLEIGDGETWGIVGPNGSGKTTLLRCLLGTTPCDTGGATWAARAKIAYYDQHLSGIEDGATVMEAIRVAGKDMNERERRSLLARFGVTGDMALQEVRSLSGGERSRAVLAWIAAHDANVLVLDEPTNHLDLWARDALERAIQTFTGTVLLVSHDRYFLNRVADHLIVIKDGESRIIRGNYDALAAATAPTSAPAKAAAGTNSVKLSGARAKKAEKSSSATKKRKFPYRKVDDLEAEIFERESRLGDLQAELSLDEVVRDGDRTRELQDALADEQAALAALYAHWEEAVELN